MHKCIPLPRISWKYYLFENWEAFLAFLKFGFFLSTILGSLVNIPFFFNKTENSSFNKDNALEIARETAPNWDDLEEPLTLIERLYLASGFAIPN